MTVANGITLLRLFLVPVFIVFFARGEHGWAFAAFCVASASDLIDGTVARLLKQPSRWGAILDPLADKLLLESAFVCLVIADILPLWFFLLALARDVMIVAGIIYLKAAHIDFPHRAIWTSKFATFAQMLTIVAGLVVIWHSEIRLGPVTVGIVMTFCMWGAVALIVASGALYVRLGVRVLKAARAKAAGGV